MKLLALLLAALLMGCNQSSAPPASDSLEVRFWHDDARHVGCWLWYPAATGRGGIACLPDSQYTTPTAQNAPTLSQDGVGRPEPPGVASVSTTAPTEALASDLGTAVRFARTGIGTAAGSLKAVASYYGTGPAGVAAAGPNLRAALGRNWRGTWVRVSYRGRSAWLRLGDACWCAVADIDIPTRTFSYLSRGELWRGLLRVTISWGDVPRLPATDAAP